MRCARVAPALAPARYPELTARYRHHYLAREGDIALFEGARELLAELDAAGYLLAVATGKAAPASTVRWRSSGLQRAFHATRCADEGLPKPHPDMLLHLMDRLDAAPRETLMIGDTTHDLELARNAGAHALAVAYGAHPAAGLAPHAAARRSCDSFAELRAWLRAQRVTARVIRA